MRNYDSPLNKIKIASPCSADWEQMYGNERKRFCGDCKLNVYNLSGMTREAAEALLLQSEGRLCVRYFRRQDGTILTRDCPVGWAAMKRRVSIFARAAAALLVSLFSGVLIASLFSAKQVEMGKMMPIPIATPTPKSTPPVSSPDDLEIMGAIAVPQASDPAPKTDGTGQMIGRVATNG